MHILYKPGPELCIVNWLSQNHHTENEGQEIMGVNVNMHAISSIPICTSIEDIQAASSQDVDLQRLIPYIIIG